MGKRDYILENEELNNLLKTFLEMFGSVNTVTEKKELDVNNIDLSNFIIDQEVKDKIVETAPIVYPRYNLMNYKNGDERMNYPGFPWGKVFRRELFEKIRFFRSLEGHDPGDDRIFVFRRRLRHFNE